MSHCSISAYNLSSSVFLNNLLEFWGANYSTEITFVLQNIRLWELSLIFFVKSSCNLATRSALNFNALHFTLFDSTPFLVFAKSSHKGIPSKPMQCSSHYNRCRCKQTSTLLILVMIAVCRTLPTCTTVWKPRQIDLLWYSTQMSASNSKHADGFRLALSSTIPYINTQPQHLYFTVVARTYEQVSTSWNSILCCWTFSLSEYLWTTISF